jgi:hypothetical protein
MRGKHRDNPASSKGVLTKALSKRGDSQVVFNAVRTVFASTCLREQAKHAARNYLAHNLAEFAR